MFDPKVTIITVCLNSAATISRTVTSVAAQTYRNIEYLVIDGDSSDGTLELLESFEREFDGRLIVHSEPDEGLYWAMNKGICLATGELIGILNSDDYYQPRAVKTVVDAWIENGCPDIVAGQTSLLDRLGHEQGFISNVKVDVPKGVVYFPHPSMFVTHEAYRKFGAFDTRYIYAADRELMYRMIFAGATFTKVNDVLSYFSQGGLGSRIGVTAQLENFRLDLRFRGHTIALFAFLKGYAYSLYNRYIYPLTARYR